MKYNNFNIENEKGIYIKSIKEEPYKSGSTERKVEVVLAFPFESVKSLYNTRKNILNKIYTTTEEKLYINNDDLYYIAIIDDINIELNNKVCYITLNFKSSPYKIKEELYTDYNLEDWRGFNYIEVQNEREYYNNPFSYEISIINKNKENFNIGKVDGVNGYKSEGFLYCRTDYTSDAGGFDDGWFLYNFELYSIYINSIKQIVEIKEIKDGELVNKMISEKGDAYYPPSYIVYKLFKEVNYLKILHQEGIDVKLKIFRKVF